MFVYTIKQFLLDFSFELSFFQICVIKKKKIKLISFSSNQIIKNTKQTNKQTKHKTKPNQTNKQTNKQKHKYIQTIQNHLCLFIK